MAEPLEINPSTSSQDFLNKNTQVPPHGVLQSPNGNIPMYPTVYPLLVPGLFPPQQEEEQMIHGPGLYAVCALPSMQPFPGYSSNTLIPFTYNIPTEPSALETTAVGGERGQAAEQQQQAGPQIQDVVYKWKWSKILLTIESTDSGSTWVASEDKQPSNSSKLDPKYKMLCEDFKLQFSLI
ncbi:uncharacterized protein LOC111365621 [Olea europaea var. sylvestris]|uniref:uncharacterized protein LOC111365621 n=1 Tax=Olea europaea var. sylvestris TaxID=158386 RepID=UPI000C1CDB9F|nr:uncharacterized protein LOC111365621 [Olea europaea var. sylvestris]